MSTPPVVTAPAGFVPRYALSFGGVGADAVAVDSSNPLPIADARVALPASSSPLIGTATENGVTASFAPQLGRPVWLALSGTWTGTVTLMRSADGGVTRAPVTYADGSARPAWTGNLQAPVVEESVAGALYYLSITVTSGSVGYRMEQ